MDEKYQAKHEMTETQMEPLDVTQADQQKSMGGFDPEALLLLLTLEQSNVEMDT